MRSTGGRNNQGGRPAGFSGGGHKRLYRIIDFRRDKMDIRPRVAAIEYDPNRTARIALLHYADGEKRYILAPNGLDGRRQRRLAGPTADILPGNALPLEGIPLGTTIHNIELKRGRGGQLVRSAGTAAQLMARRATGRRCAALRRGARRSTSSATPRSARSATSSTRTSRSGRPGRNRWLGCQPHNRGVAMNPVDHPMGGGEGKTSGGRHPTLAVGMADQGLRRRGTTSGRTASSSAAASQGVEELA